MLFTDHWRALIPRSLNVEQQLPLTGLRFISLSDINEQGEVIYPFLKGRKGGYHLVHDNFIYRSNFRRQGVMRNIYYWECINNRKGRCRGRLKTIGDKLYITNSNGKRGD